MGFATQRIINKMILENKGSLIKFRQKFILRTRREGKNHVPKFKIEYLYSENENLQFS